MQRAAHERIRNHHRRRQWQALARARGVPAADLPANFFRKHQRISGCGHANCWLCHDDKLAQRLAPQGRRAAEAFADALRELGDTSA